MKKNITLFFFSLIAFIAYGQEQPDYRNDLQKENLRGNVKTVYLYSFDYDGEKVLDWTYIFNVEGFLISKAPGPHNMFGEYTTIKYDSDNHFKEEIVTDKNANERYRDLYLYDQHGKDNLYEVIRSCDTVTLFNETYSYDNEGSLIEIEKTDNKGNKTYCNFVYNNGVLTYMIYGNEEKMITTFNGDFLRPIELLSNHNGVTTHRRTDYDSNGNAIKIEAEIDGKWLSQEKRDYDQFGNITKITLFDSNGQSFERETILYDYDEYGNWIRSTKTIFEDDEKISRIQERIIEYYL